MVPITIGPLGMARSEFVGSSWVTRQAPCPFPINGRPSLSPPEARPAPGLESSKPDVDPERNRRPARRARSGLRERAHCANTHDPDDLRWLHAVIAQPCAIANTLDDAVIPERVPSSLSYRADYGRGEVGTLAPAP